MKTFTKQHIIFLAILLLTSCNFGGNTHDISDEFSLPDDSEKIKITHSVAINNRFISDNDIGIDVGEKVNNFKLYSPSGESFDLYNELKKGKPILLVSGSYSCGPSQKNMKHINDIRNSFKDKVIVYFIHVVEAHPFDTISPYSEERKIWSSQADRKNKIRTSQPGTYGERKDLANKWKGECNLQAKMLIDNQDNYFWMEFGQGPNMAYLIEPGGSVYYKQIWFKKNPMIIKIKELLEELK